MTQNDCNEGELPVEDQGYTLYCDSCGGQARSNEVHHCTARFPPNKSGRLTGQEKIAFCRYVHRRRDAIQIAGKKDLVIMNDVASQLPDQYDKLTKPRAVAIMRKIEECEFQLADAGEAGADAAWSKFFFS